MDLVAMVTRLRAEKRELEAKLIAVNARLGNVRRALQGTTAHRVARQGRPRNGVKPVTKDSILGTLNGQAMTTREIARATKAKPSTIGVAMRLLFQQGVVARAHVMRPGFPKPVWAYTVKQAYADVQ